MKHFKTILFLIFLANCFINAPKIEAKTWIEKTESENYYQYRVEEPEKKLTYLWKYKKESNSNLDLENSLKIKNDIQITINGDTTAAKTIHRSTKEDKIVISINRFGELPEEIKITLNVSNQFKEGEKLYLYRYDENEDNLVFMENKIPVKDGISSFTVSDSANFFLTNKPIKNALHNPKKISYSIIGLTIISFLILFVTFLELRKK